jgi:hypothetical protein
MLRLSFLEAQVRHTSSAYRKILEPKPPPTSGAITRTLCSGRPITKAVIKQALDVRVLVADVERVLVAARL